MENSANDLPIIYKHPAKSLHFRSLVPFPLSTSPRLLGIRGDHHKSGGPQRRLEKLLSQDGNNLCADCGSPDPKWVSLIHGVFICIKCSGVHRSLGVQVSKVLSVKLDEWADEQVDSLSELGGNVAANKKYEACLPADYHKPTPDAAIEERSNFIRKKYEQLQFMNYELKNTLSPCPSPSSKVPSPAHSPSSPGKSKQPEKQEPKVRCAHAFRNSWGRKDSEHRHAKKHSLLAGLGMIEFVGVIKVNVVKGTNLAIRDVVTSDPYVILSLGNQSVKTRVIKNNLNPVWNERLMLSIPEQLPPLKLLVYDKDKFSTDDFMGEAEIDIQPLVSAAKAFEKSSLEEPMLLGKWADSLDNTQLKDGQISLVDGTVKQEVNLRLQKVERGVLEIELECVPLTQ